MAKRGNNEVVQKTLDGTGYQQEGKYFKSEDIESSDFQRKFSLKEHTGYRPETLYMRTFTLYARHVAKNNDITWRTLLEVSETIPRDGERKLHVETHALNYQFLHPRTQGVRYSLANGGRREKLTSIYGGDSTGIIDIEDLPEYIDVEATIKAFCAQIERQDFSDPQLIPLKQSSTR